jgi:hypothetical protein
MLAALEKPASKHKPKTSGWLVFRYAPVGLFALKSSRATSTAGKTLLIPTPYAVKMAFLDAALRCGLTNDPERLVRWLAKASLRIGVPHHACVTGTIQSIRQETRDAERKIDPTTPPYRSTIAMREVVSYQGTLSLAFDLNTCSPECVALLVHIAPAINYLGKRGSFLQYLSGVRQAVLDFPATEPAQAAAWGHHATLDDFGPQASFAALNSYSSTPVRRGLERKFVETTVPLEIHNTGPGFVHYVGRA